MFDVDALQKKAKQIVVDYYNDNVEKTDNVKITQDNVYVVWFSKTLQNWKAMVSTTVSDGMYYELTHNGDNKETYLDVYKKWENKRIADEYLDVHKKWENKRIADEVE